VLYTANRYGGEVPAPQEIATFELVHADALTLLKSLPAGSIDLIVTDPAYESLEKWRGLGTTTRLKKSKSSSNAWFEIFPNSRFPEFFSECYRVLKKNSHCFILCDQETLFAIKPMAEAAGFKFWKFLVWDKSHPGMGYHYRASHEVILFLEKGKRKLHNTNIPDVLRIPRIAKRSAYPTEKPVALLKTLIENSSEPGSLILDPFMGSGSTGAAALSCGRRFLGGDLSQESLRWTQERLADPLLEISSPGSLGVPAPGPVDSLQGVGGEEDDLWEGAT
jgi:site-specific DNA-methyltransferase (adenine-specific)